MSNKVLRIALAQLNFTVGDIKNNLDKHICAVIEVRDQLSADVIVFPELSLTGYPPEDLLLRDEFIKEAENALHTLARAVKNIYCVVGYPQKTNKNHHAHNACAIIHNGKILDTYAKQCLPHMWLFGD